MNSLNNDFQVENSPYWEYHLKNCSSNEVEMKKTFRKHRSNENTQTTFVINQFLKLVSGF